MEKEITMGRHPDNETPLTALRRERIKSQIDYLLSAGVKKIVIRKIVGLSTATFVKRLELNNWTRVELTRLENGLPTIFQGFPTYGRIYKIPA